MSEQPSLAAERALHADFLNRYPIEAATALEAIPADDAATIVAEFDAAKLAPVFENLSPGQATALLARAPSALMTATLNRMSAPRAAALLRVVPEDRRTTIVAQLDRNARADLELLLESPPDSAAAIMDPRVFYLRPEMRVQDALDLLKGQRFHRRHAQAIRVMLLVDDAKRLEGIVAVQDLALAHPQDYLRDYMQPIPALVPLTATKEEIVEQMDLHRLSSLPVVDNGARLVGIVRQEELVAAAKEEATADLQAMFGVSRTEHALSTAWEAIKKRHPWLQINLVTAFVAAAVVGLFEGTIAKFTALAVLLPVVAGQSGNTGYQALAVVMRGLALREISLLHWPRVMLKEFTVGFVNGAGVAVTTAAGVYVWSQSLGLVAIITASMIASLIIAGCSGAAIPLILTRVGLDPAQSSSIILTTVTDVAGFFSFLGIATLLIGLLQ
jgi:magnesium transporter